MRAAGVVAALLAACGIARGDEVYGCDSSTDELYIIETATGSLVSVIGPITIGGTPATTPVAMAVRPGDGAIFINNNSPAGINGLCRVDPATGTGVFIGGADMDQSLAWAAGSLWSLNGGQLARINPSTGAATPLGGPSLPRIFGMDFNPRDGFMYAITSPGPGSIPELLRLNITTGAIDAAIPMSDPLSGNPQSLLFEADGTLVGAGGGQMFDIDPATGVMTNFRTPDRRPQGMGRITFGGGGGQRFFGLQHEPLGSAQLDLVFDGLRVSNIGSSGLDGVRVDLGSVESHVIELDLPAPFETVDGSYFQSTTMGQLDGLGGQEIIAYRATDVGQQSLIGIDFTQIGPGTVQLRVFDGDLLVFEGPIDPGPGFTSVLRSEQPLKKTDPYWRMDPECWFILEFEIPGLLDIAGGPVVQGDKMVVAMSDASRVVGDLEAVRIQALDIPEFFFQSEQVGKFGVLHQVMGDETVALTATADALDLDIPQGGTGGLMQVDLPDFVRPDQGVLNSMGLFDLDDLDIILGARGTFGGQTGEELGSLDIDNGILLKSDFDTLGSPDAILQLYLDDALVYEDTIADGLLLTMDEPIIIGGCGKLPPDPPCFWLPLGDVFGGTPLGGPPVDFDEIRVLAASPSATIDRLESYSLIAMVDDARTISFTGFEAVDPFEACRADLDGDGRLSIFDFLEFQNLFAMGDPRADFDGDGRFSIFDFLQFQNEFAAGC